MIEDKKGGGPFLSPEELTALFDEEFHQWNGWLVGVATKRLSRVQGYHLARQTAEDVCQEAWLCAWRRRGVFDPSRGAPLHALVAHELRYAIGRFYQSFSRESAGASGPLLSLSDPGLGSATPMAKSPSLVEHTLVSQLLARLPSARQRATLAHLYWGNETPQEAADALGTTRKRLNCTTNRALAKCRKFLGITGARNQTRLERSGGPAGRGGRSVGWKLGCAGPKAPSTKVATQRSL